MIYVYVLTETIIDDGHMFSQRSHDRHYGYYGTYKRARAASYVRGNPEAYGHRWRQEAADHWVCGYFHIRKERIL